MPLSPHVHQRDDVGGRGQRGGLSSTRAALPGGCRVVTAETLPWLRDAVRGWATALAGDDQYATPMGYASSSPRKPNGRSPIDAHARPAIASS